MIALGSDGVVAQSFEFQLRLFLADRLAAGQEEERGDSEQETMGLNHVDPNANLMPAVFTPIKYPKTHGGATERERILRRGSQLVEQSGHRPAMSRGFTFEAFLPGNYSEMLFQRLSWSPAR